MGYEGELDLNEVVEDNVECDDEVPVVNVECDDDMPDINEQFENEEIENCDDLNCVDEPPVVCPEVGMTFPSWQELESFYSLYAERSGFGIVRNVLSRRRKGGVLTDQLRNGIWRCECFGKPETRRKGKNGISPAEKNVNSKKCGCPAYVYAIVNDDNVWEVRKVILEHKNHSPTPYKSKHISKYRQKELGSCTVARTLFKAKEANLPVCQIHKLLALQRNGFENLSVKQRDVRNKIDKDRRLEMAGGDANAMVQYFNKMKADNDEFFYTYRTDNLGNMTDVLWVDARCKAAYEEFGDVVSFDSTYLTNRSELPFCNSV